MRVSGRTLAPLLVLTTDAPTLPMSLTRATEMIDMNFAHVQDNFLQTIGSTFVLEPCLVYQSKQGDRWSLWDFYYEMEQAGLIEKRGPNLTTLYYMQVWHPQPSNHWITGTLMAEPVGRCVDGAGPVEDFLGLPKPDDAWIHGMNAMSQGRGRARHEGEHGLRGPHPERIFGNWWDYGRGLEKPSSDPGFQEELATLNHLWLPVKRHTQW